MICDLTAENLWAVIGELRGNAVITIGNKTIPKNKLVHCIMNYVAAADCANALLAVGARPVMADSPEESAEITDKSAALVLNMGTFSPERGQAMIDSCRAANKANIPVIIDPVGLQVSGLRYRYFRRLNRESRLTAVKGNLQEITAVVGADFIKKVRSDNSTPFDEWLTKTAAKKLSCTVLMTGERDVLSDGKQMFVFGNGTPHLTAVTGTGCITGVLIGACAAVGGSALVSCAAAVSLVNICGELAEENFRGTGSFRTDLIDKLSQITREQFLERIKFTEITQ